MGSTYSCTSKEQKWKSFDATSTANSTANNIGGSTKGTDNELIIDSSGGKDDHIRNCPGPLNTEKVKTYLKNVFNEYIDKINETKDVFFENLEYDTTTPTDFVTKLTTCETNCDTVDTALKDIKSILKCDNSCSQLTGTQKDYINTSIGIIYGITTTTTDKYTLGTSSLPSKIATTFNSTKKFFTTYTKSDVDSIDTDNNGITYDNVHPDKVLLKYIDYFMLHSNDKGKNLYVGDEGTYGNGKLPSPVKFITDNKYKNKSYKSYRDTYHKLITNYNTNYTTYHRIITKLNTIKTTLSTIITHMNTRNINFLSDTDRPEILFENITTISVYFNDNFNDLTVLKVALEKYKETQRIIKYKLSAVNEFNSRYQFNCDQFGDKYHMFVDYSKEGEQEGQYSNYLLNPTAQYQGANIYDEGVEPLCVKSADEDKCYAYLNKDACINHLSRYDAVDTSSTFSKEPIFPEKTTHISAGNIHSQTSYNYKATLWNPKSDLHDSDFDNTNLMQIRRLDDKPNIITTTTVPNIVPTTTDFTYVDTSPPPPATTIKAPPSYPKHHIPPGKYHLKMVDSDEEEHYMYLDQSSTGEQCYHINKKSTRSSSDKTDIFEVYSQYEIVNRKPISVIIIKLKNKEIYLTTKDSLYKNMLVFSNYKYLDVAQEVYFKISNHRLDNQHHVFNMTSLLNIDNYCGFFPHPDQDSVLSTLDSTQPCLYEYVNNSEKPKYHCSHSPTTYKFKLVPV